MVAHRCMRLVWYTSREWPPLYGKIRTCARKNGDRVRDRSAESSNNLSWLAASSSVSRSDNHGADSARAQPLRRLHQRAQGASRPRRKWGRTGEKRTEGEGNRTVRS